MKTDSERGDSTRRFTDEMVGFDARAEDPVGHIERVTYDGEWAVVANGRLKKHRYAVPAWAIRVVDARNEAVLLGLTKDEIEAAPEYDDRVGIEDDQAEELTSYYDRLLSGHAHVRAA